MNEAAPRGDIAIIGLACTFPGARDAGQFWQNIIRKVDAVTDVTTDRWDPDYFYDPNPDTEDRIYCKKGGWIGGDYAFNPLKFGIMPSALEGTEADHFLVLRAAYEAMGDAGYLEKKTEGLRVNVIIGKGNYTGPGVTALMYRSIVTEQVLAILRGLHPEFTEEDIQKMKTAVRATLPRLTPEGAAGLIPNICTGRIANRLGLMGRNFTVDAACASSLIATEIAMQDLLSGQADMVLSGGVHIFSHIPFLQVFDTMRALSLGSQIRPYDEHCDGTIPGEGVGVLVLKRLADAERDGDRVYAVIRGAGSSSDGRAKGIVAPRVEGEELALRRALEMSDVDPCTVSLIEGHGTGTAIGDAAEAAALRRVYGTDGKPWPTCAVGSVKSMIGHAMPAAGSASLIKTALALYHRVLPPTLNCQTPREDLVGGDSRFYVNTEARPWIHPRGSRRRAGVNAFGFGGINAHLVLEEYIGPAEREQLTLQQDWDAEFVVIEANSRPAIVAAAETLRKYAAKVEGVALRDIAYTLNSQLTGSPERLAIVATTIEDLCQKLDSAIERLAQPGGIKDRQGIYYFTDSGVKDGPVAVIFPGEGSQYLNMLADLCIHFPEVREAFDLADSASKDPQRQSASALIFSPRCSSEEEISMAEERLFTIDRATEAVLTTDAAVFKLLETLDIRPRMMAGHSAGEWIALAAAGVLDTEEFFGSMDRLSAMHEKIARDEDIPRRSMLAVAASREKVERLAQEVNCAIEVANDNCTRQVVIVTAPEDEPAVKAQLQKNGIFVEKLPYDRGYHTPAFTYISEPLREYFSQLEIRAAKIPLYSCTTAKTYPEDRSAILDMVSQTFVKPLLFRQTIEAMHADGARIFIESGPRGNLSAFVDDILRGKPHLCVSMDQFRRPGLVTLNHSLAMLCASHVPLNVVPLYQRRSARLLKLDAVADSVLREEEQPGTVMVSIRYPRLGVPEPLPQVEPTSTVPTYAWRHSTEIPQTDALEEIAAEWVPDREIANGHVHAAVSGHDVAGPLNEHLLLMDEFLRTHEAVMLASMGAAAGAGSTTTIVRSTAPPDAPFHHQQVPTQNAPAASPASGHNGSISQVAAAVGLPPPTSQPQVAPVDLLLRIVSERTGYPIGMLGLDLDLEADLGIDSIKRVEILSELQEIGRDAGLPASADMEEVARLKTLRQVLAYLETSRSGGQSQSTQDLSSCQKALRTASLIKGSEIVRFSPEQSLRLRCILDVDEHLFLRDHRLYFDASDHKSEGYSILSMPMTGSLEIMAETASLLSPSGVVAGAKSVQALRWINVNEQEKRAFLTVAATRVDSRSIRVAIWPDSDPDDPEPKSSSLLAEATILFEPKYSAPPSNTDLKLVNPREPFFPGQTLYSEHLMFHGGSFQGIVAIDNVGENGLHGRLTVLPTDGLLGSDRSPRFHIDPFLLDAAGQMVGYWPIEYLSEGNIALPIRIGNITLHREGLPPGTPAHCQVRIREVKHRQFRGDFDVIAPDGTIWMQVTGWEDWRFYWEKHIHEFWRFPKRNPNGQKVTLPEALEREGLVCQRIDPMSEMDKTGLWELLWMQMILNNRELGEHQSFQDADARAAWIFERAAAKDAARSWIKKQSALNIYPADIEIQKDPAGRLAASCSALDSPPMPALAAIAVDKVGLGVASPSPVAVYADKSRSGGDESLARLACVKGAAEKLVGQGAVFQRISSDGEAMILETQSGDPNILVYTVVDEGIILAIARFTDLECPNN